MKVQRHQLRIAAAVLALGALAGCGTAASAETGSSTPSRSVAATATGSATGVPDQLVANVGINNQGSSASDVLSENNAKTQALLDDLKQAGIDDKDVATTSVDLSPRYDDNGNITLKAELLVEDAARFAPLEPLPEEPRRAAE